MHPVTGLQCKLLQESMVCKVGRVGESKGAKWGVEKGWGERGRREGGHGGGGRVVGHAAGPVHVAGPVEWLATVQLKGWHVSCDRVCLLACMLAVALLSCDGYDVGLA